MYVASYFYYLSGACVVNYFKGKIIGYRDIGRLIKSCRKVYKVLVLFTVYIVTNLCTFMLLSGY